MPLKITQFWHQNIKLKPKKGSLVLWPTGFTHMHRGNKPISNDKSIVLCFITLTGGMTCDETGCLCTGGKNCLIDEKD